MIGRRLMFFDSNAWPPAPGGSDPPPAPPPRISPAQERTILRMMGILMLVLFLGPFAGSSLVLALVALWRSVAAAFG